MSVKFTERFEDVFQDKILPSFASTDAFKRFARSSKGLRLNEYDIQKIAEDCSTVEEQKLQMLQLWKQRTGTEATVSMIRTILSRFLHSESDQDYVSLNGEYGFKKDRKISEHSYVYIGEHRSGITNPREVVVKLVQSNEKNKREVENLLNLGAHTNVVTMFHHGIYESGLQKFIYIVMESCHPENLGDYFQKMKKLGLALNDSQKKAIIKQFLEGLEFIHSSELIHRDIKPQNLLISRNGKFIKICDYGLSKPLHHGCSNTSQSVSNPGTDGFRAPETYLNDEISQKTDVYSAGLVSYAIVSDGEHAFGNDRHKWNSNIKKNKNRSLSNINIKEKRPMKSVLEHMLQHNPKKRATVVEVLQNDIFRQAATNLQLVGIQKTQPSKAAPSGNEASSKQSVEEIPISSNPQVEPLKEAVSENEVSSDDVEIPVPLNKFEAPRIFLNEQPQDGKMICSQFKESLPGRDEPFTFVITYSIPSGQIEGISYLAQEFTAYLPKNLLGRLALHLLAKAFNAGKTFKLEIIEEGQGKIVWNDIPHKTSTTGGPEKVHKLRKS